MTLPQTKLSCVVNIDLKYKILFFVRETCEIFGYTEESIEYIVYVEARLAIAAIANLLFKSFILSQYCNFVTEIRPESVG